MKGTYVKSIFDKGKILQPSHKCWRIRNRYVKTSDQIPRNFSTIICAVVVDQNKFQKNHIKSSVTEPKTAERFTSVTMAEIKSPRPLEHKVIHKIIPTKIQKCPTDNLQRVRIFFDEKFSK